ncbi:uncharacterized protein [Nicotiana tomentosiformis]|uniref:uncharacterized protein n=1 Tax=Nicotiana tomentosiformis TaxID=4098 RepID=UPI00388C57F9
MVVEWEAPEYDSIFALIAKSVEDEDDDDDDDDAEVNFLDVQRNLKFYSQKKLVSLANVLIDYYHNLINDKNILTMKLGEAEHERDDLLVVVVDLKETIEDLKNEKDVLTEKIEKVEYARDDLLIVVVDLKKTVEEFKRENISMKASIENYMNSSKGKEVVSETHLKLENKFKMVKLNLCAELERNRQLQEDLSSVKNNLDKSLKWTWSSDTITYMYKSNGGNWQGFGLQKEKAPYNPHSKYVIVPDNWLCTHCGNTGILKIHGAVKESNQRWYMDSDCSKHMTGTTDDFLSLKTLQGGSVFFGNGKKGYILGVGRVGKTLTHSVENVYYVNGLKYNLLSVSQICDKGHKVEFLSKSCTVTNLVTGEVVLVAKRFKNIYVADFESLNSGDLTCLSVVDDDVELWHRRLGHARFSLPNKLVKKDLVRGLPKSKFKDHKV